MFTDYVLVYPSGNIMALVTAPVKAEDRKSVVKEIFENEPSCEQLGFVEFIGENSISLEMMDGEFCDKATISAAAYLAESYCVPVYEDMNVNVLARISGVDTPMSVYVIRKKDTVEVDDASGLEVEKHNYMGKLQQLTCEIIL